MILALLGQFVGQIEQPAQLIGKVHLARRAFDAGQTIQGLAQMRAHHVDIDPSLGQQVADRAAILIQQRQHQMRRLDKLVVPAYGETLGIGQRQLKFAG